MFFAFGEAALRQRIRELETELAMMRLENQLLADLNENCRMWLLANTAATTRKLLPEELEAIKAR